MLGHFFDHVNSAAFDAGAFPADISLATHIGQVDTPAQFVGDLSGPDPDDVMRLLQQPHASHFTESPISQPGLASEDVVFAASTLVGNGRSRMHHGRQQSSDGTMLGHAATYQPYQQVPTTTAAPYRYHGPEQMMYAPALQHCAPLVASAPAPATSTSPTHYMSPLGASESYATRYGFSPPRSTLPASSASARSSGHAKPIDVRWGSDTSFLDNAYAPNEQLARGFLLKEEHNFARTQEPSNLDGTHDEVNVTPSASSSDHRLSTSRTEGGSSHPATPADDVSIRRLSPAPPPPKKRQRTCKATAGANVVEPGDDGHVEEVDTSTQPTRPSRKSSGALARQRSGIASANATASKTPKQRRTPAPGRSSGGTSGRATLTSEQKRLNHIASERKRRAGIQQSFDEFIDMVPGLRAGGYSKSVTILRAAGWLNDLIKGNNELRAELGLSQPRWDT